MILNLLLQALVEFGGFVGFEILIRVVLIAARMRGNIAMSILVCDSCSRLNWNWRDPRAFMKGWFIFLIAIFVF